MLSPHKFQTTNNYHHTEMHQRSLSSKKTGDMLFQEAILRVFHGGRAWKCIISLVELLPVTLKDSCSNIRDWCRWKQSFNLGNLVDAAAQVMNSFMVGLSSHRLFVQECFILLKKQRTF